jgi:hypothetical protein
MGCGLPGPGPTSLNRARRGPRHDSSRTPDPPRSLVAHRCRTCGTARNRAPSQTLGPNGPGARHRQPRSQRLYRDPRPSPGRSTVRSQPHRLPERAAPERRREGPFSPVPRPASRTAPANAPSPARRSIAGGGRPTSQGAGPSRYDISVPSPATGVAEPHRRMQRSLWQAERSVRRAMTSNFAPIGRPAGSPWSTIRAMQTVCEAAGGEEGLRRFARAWYARVMADGVVSHAPKHE